jgi:hypothetical protein
MKSCAVASVLAACFLAHSRPTGGCVPGATRYSDNVAELCDADGSYREFADCELVSKPSGAPFVGAFVSNLELHFWRYASTPSARRIAELLRDYGCRSEDVDVAAKSLALSAASVRRGTVMNEATHGALGWLDDHLLPRLRAKRVA